MTVVFALLAALMGGALGGVIGFIVYIGIGELAGADTQQGALAMGAAVAGLPLGAVIGAALGAVLVVRARRRRPQPTAQAPIPENEPARSTPQSIGNQGWIALGLVAACIAGGLVWFNWTGEPARYSMNGKRPILLVEIRVPVDDPDIEAALTRGTNLRNAEVYHGMDGAMQRAVDGDYAILKSTHPIMYKTEDRSVELWLGLKRLLIFNLDLPRKPPEQPDFSAWRAVDHVRPNFYGKDYVPEGGHDYHIRTRVVWAGR